MLENKRLSASPGKGKRMLEEGEPSKEEATSRKKRKSATRMKFHEDKNYTEEIGKEGSEMEIDESEGEDNWKDEEMGAEHEEGENESDNDNPIHSASPGNDNNQPMNLDKNGKQKDDKRKEDDRDQKQWKKEMEEKVNKMATQINLLEEGKVAMKNLLGIIPNILSAVTKNLEDISKIFDNSYSPKIVVDLDMDEYAIKIGSGEATSSGAGKRTRVWPDFTGFLGL
ncbi:uncharacterized protein LOC131859000 [Cryptomeria japonica]|uniref:uncharacterized protein LOC131859000 n=1 Tax=Cryptomeria japonica TaxID=3369 RepID=UPI0027D9E30E|nr:uncharacterized protein LOC131859000 [Cryptomeria japonica]